MGWQVQAQVPLQRAMGRSRSSGGACGAVFRNGELTVEEGDNVFVARAGETVKTRPRGH